jgi:hypothetical protein
MRTFYFRNRDPLTIVTLHRIASACAGDNPLMAAACVQSAGPPFG